MSGERRKGREIPYLDVNISTILGACGTPMCMRRSTGKLAYGVKQVYGNYQSVGASIVSDAHLRQYDREDERGVRVSADLLYLVSISLNTVEKRN